MFRQVFCALLWAKNVQTQKTITYLTPDEHKKFVTVFCISLTEPNGPRKKKNNLKTYKKLEYSLCMRKKTQRTFLFFLWRIMHVRMMI